MLFQLCNQPVEAIIEQDLELIQEAMHIPVDQIKAIADNKIKEIM